MATPATARYAKQLASHLGRRSGVTVEGATTTLTLTDGTCVIHSTDTALELRASADTVERLSRVTGVVGSHLERFGRRDRLVVTWS